MIQRIQSFLLVLAACGIALMFMFPTATFVITDENTASEINSELGLIAKASCYDTDCDLLLPTFLGQKDVPMKGLWAMPVLAAIIGVIALVSIFLYKNRMLQMKVVAFGFLLNVIYIFLTFFWFVDGFTKAIATMGFPSPTPHFSVGTWTPIVTVALFYFAQRGIKKDEMKVRAADRLR